MAIKIETEVTITAVYERLTEDGQVKSYATFEGASGDVQKITGTLPVAHFGGVVHAGQNWRVTFDTAPVIDQADKE